MWSSWVFRVFICLGSQGGVVQCLRVEGYGVVLFEDEAKMRTSNVMNKY